MTDQRSQINLKDSLWSCVMYGPFPTFKPTNINRYDKNKQKVQQAFHLKKEGFGKRSLFLKALKWKSLRILVKP